MGFIGSVLGTISGSLPDLLGRAIDKVLPEKITPQEKAQIQLELERAAHQHELQVMQAANEADAEFNRRLRDMEGTAGDLRAVPIVGPLLILLRGAIRPAFGLAVLVWDWKVLSGAWNPPDQELFLAINLLVLGFHFGERAMRNVAPLLQTRVAGGKR